ncbi:helix-turn-helix domain-containing protein [Companilactobacillus zhongbaensis]|uniref:helix-turn-helix domain-containing protein n=1 Tax=Companilactobacillus zhongbaensis TaxID=2486009 RepID=UPI0013DDF4DD|nr:helix-turn-helix transcriptional regulator [Companilactobacillus zhongbaensis]
MFIGSKISDLRASRGCSQEKLAELLLVSRQTISNWENDKTYPDIDRLVALSDLFDVSLDELIKEDIPLMKNKIARQKIRLYGFSFISVLVLSYLSLITLKWSISLGSWLVGAFCVLGLVLLYFLWKTADSANLKTFSQIVSFSQNKLTPPVHRSKAKIIWLTILGGIIGLGIGLVLVWLIFHFVLNLI